MKERLSFATLNVLSDNILELHIDDGIEVSIEMVEEFDQYVSENLGENFAMLVNRVNHYQCTFGAKMIAGSQSELCATAIVTYNDEDKRDVENTIMMRKVDDLNLRVFSGLDLGWQSAYDWLEAQVALTVVPASETKSIPEEQ